MAKTTSKSSSLSSEQLATIIVLAIMFVLCCASCCTCLYKFKGYQTYARIIPSQTVNRARGYEMVPETSLAYVTENNIQQCMPKLKFLNNMIEVGVKTCCICFDDLEEGILVRKLVCKHIFHANCIESWFVNAEGFPKCPVCKANPFQNITEAMNIHIAS
ncbi:unnamed protein product [Blepharisma stoltei]|uniref:RING-type domain-containing protein n=1 Tax=Blepharisma stoltei TaxID=1481888 RepID=A0AAU9JSX7_9CILI|nr:unnamed protein product [Blepharisma stoltei]